MTLMTLDDKPGSKIRLLRNMECLTLKDVSDKSGLTQSMISQIEKGYVDPTFKTLAKIIRAINPAFTVGFHITDQDDKIFKSIRTK